VGDREGSLFGRTVHRTFRSAAAWRGLPRKGIANRSEILALESSLGAVGDCVKSSSGDKVSILTTIIVEDHYLDRRGIALTSPSVVNNTRKS
jgi:hypothetical protein